MHTEAFRRIESELPVLLAVSVALCATVLCARFWLVPSTRALLDQRQELALYRNALGGQGSYEAIKQEIRQDAGRLRERLDAYSQGMGDPSDLSALLGVLIDRADSAGVRFVRIQPQNEMAAGDYTEYPVVLEFTTEYDPLGRLIASLESLPQLVRVDRVAVTAVREGRLDVSILCTCLLHVASGEGP